MFPSFAASQPSGSVRVKVDGGSTGRVFEGIGALSAGASSRLLIDYPEPARSEILDFLFKPQYAASLQHLKVEIGGDINSTDGSEPSCARSRQEFLNPKPEYFDRGYEWWLMKEAKKRNPAIMLDILQWGAPSWIGDRDPGPGALKSERFYSQDNAEFIIGFIRGAKMYHNLTIDYCGIWNETPYEVEWIKLLRRTLDAAGLINVKIVAADQTPDVAPAWNIAETILTDPDLSHAVHAIGAHYASSTAWKFAIKEPYASTEEARETEKPLWASEEGPWRGDWEGARSLAKIFNRSYVMGSMTKIIIWSLVTSYYDNLPIPGSGPMRANSPWSGTYDVQPATWAIAHTTQFVQPGWRYMDQACGYIAAGGSYVALRDTASSDWSMIVETMDATTPRTIEVSVSGGLSVAPLTVWRTTEGSEFVQQPDVRIVDGSFSFTAEPNAIYSISTRRGQKKGFPVHIAQAASDFPFPYQDSFEESPVGKAPRYLSDLNGSFEVSDNPKGTGHVLSQVVGSLGIDWPLAKQPTPRTIIGSSRWKDYQVSCDVNVGETGWAGIGVRFDKPWDSGYWLRVTSGGQWKVLANGKPLAAGTEKKLAHDEWHRLSLSCRGGEIVASIGGKRLASFIDATFKSGMAVLGTGWNAASFDNLEIRPLQ